MHSIYRFAFFFYNHPALLADRVCIHWQGRPVMSKSSNRLSTPTLTTIWHNLFFFLPYIWNRSPYFPLLKIKQLKVFNCTWTYLLQRKKSFWKYVNWISLNWLITFTIILSYVVMVITHWLNQFLKLANKEVCFKAIQVFHTESI